MTAMARGSVIGLALLTVVAAGGSASQPLRGACYCRADAVLHCTANLSEQDCRRHCDEALCDDWFWKERLPCWNWGYGG